MSSWDTLCFDCQLEGHASCAPDINLGCKLNTGSLGEYQPPPATSKRQYRAGNDPPSTNMVTAATSYGGTAPMASNPKTMRTRSQTQEALGNSPNLTRAATLAARAGTFQAYAADQRPRRRNESSASSFDQRIFEQTETSTRGQPHPMFQPNKPMVAEPASSSGPQDPEHEQPANEELDAEFNEAFDQEFDEGAATDPRDLFPRNPYGKYDCDNAFCSYKGKEGMARIADLLNHRHSQHGQARLSLKRGRRTSNKTKRFRCTEPGCTLDPSEMFSRRDFFKKHLMDKHGVDLDDMSRRQSDHTTGNRPSMLPTVSAFSRPVSAARASSGIASYGLEPMFDDPPTDTYPRLPEPLGRISHSGSRDNGSRQGTPSSSTSNSLDAELSGRSWRHAPSGTQERSTSASPHSHVRARANAGDSGSFMRDVTSQMAQTSLKQQPVRAMARDSGSFSDGSASGSQKKAQIDNLKKAGSLGGPSKTARSFKP